jgi:hypothetical protein
MHVYFDQHRIKHVCYRVLGFISELMIEYTKLLCPGELIMELCPL